MPSIQDTSDFKKTSLEIKRNLILNPGQKKFIYHLYNKQKFNFIILQ